MTTLIAGGILLSLIGALFIFALIGAGISHLYLGTKKVCKALANPFRKA